MRMIDFILGNSHAHKELMYPYTRKCLLAVRSSFSLRMRYIVRIGLGISIVVATELAWAFPVSITTTIEGGDRPTVIGKTNLPNSMKLMVTITRAGNSYMAQGEAVVSDGQFRVGPFSKKGSPLDPGTYQVEVSSPLAQLQPQSVRTIIGKNGESQDGPLTRPSALDGKVVEYQTKVVIGTAAAAVRNDGERERATRQTKMQIAEFIRHGRSMERYRREDLVAASECGKQMRAWQPKVKALDRSLDFGVLKAAAGEAISCVSCLPSAKTYCDRAEELLSTR